MCFLRGLVHNDYIYDNAVLKTKIYVILFFRTSEFHSYMNFHDFFFLVAHGGCCDLCYSKISK